jgi:putative transcriptional regulator
MTSFAGSFLVARSALKDPNFAQTVVLILAHGEEGAYGLVVNRPSAIEGVPVPAFVGGPCESPGMILLHAHEDWVDDDSDGPFDDEEPSRKGEVAPGVFLGDAQCLKRAGNPEPGEAIRARLFRGYSGWGPGQLEQELVSGAWALVPASADLLFGTDADELWDNLSPPVFPEPSLN